MPDPPDIPLTNPLDENTPGSSEDAPRSNGKCHGRLGRFHSGDTDERGRMARPTAQAVPAPSRKTVCIRRDHRFIESVCDLESRRFPPPILLLRAGHRGKRHWLRHCRLPRPGWNSPRAHRTLRHPPPRRAGVDLKKRPRRADPPRTRRPAPIPPSNRRFSREMIDFGYRLHTISARLSASPRSSSVLVPANYFRPSQG
jgi:hypothetical protein